MTCSTYANRPRTREDERKTAEIFELPSARFERAAYWRGMAMGRKLCEQAPNRVRWTVTVLTRDAIMLSLSIGLLAGMAIGQWVLR